MKKLVVCLKVKCQENSFRWQGYGPEPFSFYCRWRLLLGVCYPNKLWVNRARCTDPHFNHNITGHQVNKFLERMDVLYPQLASPEQWNTGSHLRRLTASQASVVHDTDRVLMRRVIISFFELESDAYIHIFYDNAVNIHTLFNLQFFCVI